MKINGGGEAAFSDHELTAMKLKDQRMNKKRSDKDDDSNHIIFILLINFFRFNSI